MKHCPDCSAPTAGAFFCGLPGWICPEHDPPLAGGPSVWLAYQLSAGDIVIGPLVQYRPGDYWGTLWAWVCGRFG